MHFDYCLQLAVIKAQAKGEYTLRFMYDERAFTEEDARGALAWYVACLEDMCMGVISVK